MSLSCFKPLSFGDTYSISPFTGAWTPGDVQRGWKATIEKPEETRELPSSREQREGERPLLSHTENAAFLKGEGTVTQQMPIRSNLLPKLAQEWHGLLWQVLNCTTLRVFKNGQEIERQKFQAPRSWLSEITYNTKHLISFFKSYLRRRSMHNYVNTSHNFKEALVYQKEQ